MGGMSPPDWIVAVTLMLGAGGTLIAQRVCQDPVIEIQRATVIAFYPPASGGSEENATANEALSDFQYYAERMKRSLVKSAIDFQELYVRCLRIDVDKKTTVFRPKLAIGYFLIAPGKKPDIQYGVMTDDDLMVVARRYFGLIAARD